MTESPRDPRTLIDDLLAEQRQLTAVAHFARAHERDGISAARFEQLLPLSAPRPGEQYAFEVDLDRCSGCKACVTACHSLNGLDEGESWRDVGALFGEALVPEPGGGNRVEPLQQLVTTACHHCIEPACLEGCPVLAYHKDPVTGIVRHLDDQCIGCSYCVLKCPYDVPKYSPARGIVRKCDLCHGRLAEGEAPACAQACPNEAIRITLVETESVRAQFSAARQHEWLPDAPAPDYTLPTTRYVTQRPDAALRSADHARPRPQPPHWPLILMLVLTQAGIGGFATATLQNFQGRPGLASAAVQGPGGGRLSVVSLAWLFAGLVASIAHLGRPEKGWRIWLGWRTSWLSREAIGLNLFAAAAVLAVAVPGRSAIGSLAPLLLGAAVLFTQSMVYADTRREFWSLARAVPRFFGTAIVLGLGLALLAGPSPPVALTLLVASLAKVLVELAVLKHADSDSDEWGQLRRTAALQRGVLRPVLAMRLSFALSGGLLLPFLLVVGPASSTQAAMAFVLCLLGELTERYLFFTSVAPDRMP